MSDEQVAPWAGWSVANVAYHVGPYPGRQSIALYWVIGATSEPVAYFRSDTDALTFLHWLNKLAVTGPAVVL